MVQNEINVINIFMWGDIMKLIKRLLNKTTVRQQLFTMVAVSVVAVVAITAMALWELSRANQRSSSLHAHEYTAAILGEQAKVSALAALSDQQQLLLATTPAERTDLGKRIGRAADTTVTKIAGISEATSAAAERNSPSAFVELAKSWQQESAAFAELVQRQPLDPNAFDISVRSSFLDLEIKSKKIIRQLTEIADAQMMAAETALSMNIVSHERSVRIIVSAVVVLILVLSAVALFVTAHLRAELGCEPGAAKKIAREIATGNLTVDIQPRTGDSESVLAALAVMKSSLLLMIEQIGAGAGAVKLASEEIAAANNELSSKTNEQASALETAIHNVKNTAEVVRKNADSALAAERSAVDAAQIALAAAQAGHAAAENMTAIVQSSRDISEITAVIEGIAFQTNLLALNAAVESAHAGNHGNGFGVIAKEVRALSQKVVESSNRIRQVIKTSSKTIEDGRELVQRTESAMKEIGRAITLVNGQIGKISQASAAQRGQIETIEKMLDDIGDTTLKNAARVEQTAAASSMLDEQTEGLNNLVSKFKTN